MIKIKSNDNDNDKIFFTCTNRINLLNLKQNSGRLVVVAKRVLEAAKLAYATKTKDSVTSQKLGAGTFGELLIVFSSIQRTGSVVFCIW